MRRTALARTGPPRRKSRLRPVSDAKRRENAERASWVRGRCVFAGPDCSGRIDPHELVRRSQLRGAALDRRIVVWVCRHHHRLDENKAESVALFGLRIDPHLWRLCGGDPEREQELIDLAAARRERAREMGLA